MASKESPDALVPGVSQPKEGKKVLVYSAQAIGFA